MGGQGVHPGMRPNQMLAEQQQQQQQQQQAQQQQQYLRQQALRVRHLNTFSLIYAAPRLCLDSVQFNGKVSFVFTAFVVQCIIGATQCFPVPVA